jgi:putative SbcD/Mre11-related phosphoesterase
MITMLFQPTPNIPALYIPEKNILILSDLHIGIENELRGYGVLTNSQTSRMKNLIQDLCKTFHPKEIFILGDVKHTIPSTPFYEKKHLYEFLASIQRYAQIHIIPGNHDGNIQKIIPSDIILHGSDGYQKDDFAFIHGHRWPNKEIMQCNYLFCGHTHPTVKLTDRLGYHSYEPCWIKSPIKKVQIQKKYSSFNSEMIMIIFPVFNPICGGIAVNEEGVLGPIQHMLNEDKAELYLLDGTLLGGLGNWKRKS